MPHRRQLLAWAWLGLLAGRVAPSTAAGRTLPPSNNYLAPMHASQGLPVVQVDMHGAQATRTPQGQGITHDALVRAWGVKVAPTVLFLGRGGREVADRLVGGSPDFYHAYLERRLEQARRTIAG